MLEKLIDEDSTDLYDQFLSPAELKALFRSARDASELILAARHLGADVESDTDTETS